MDIDVMMGPAEFEGLAGKPMPGVVCVVFDVLRATSTLLTALEQGAEGIFPVATVEEALEVGRRDPSVLLAGERGGVRIGPEISGGRGFDLGNSPREFTRERVGGRRIAMTTTNGTRALRACRGAEAVLAGSFLNLGAVAAAAGGLGAARILLVGSGTGEGAALEDSLAAGACCERLRDSGEFGDAAWLAYDGWQRAKADLEGAIGRARNARRLRTLGDLAADVAYCARVDVSVLVPCLGRDGWLRVGGLGAPRGLDPGRVSP